MRFIEKQLIVPNDDIIPILAPYIYGYLKRNKKALTSVTVIDMELLWFCIYGQFPSEKKDEYEVSIIIESKIKIENERKRLYQKFTKKKYNIMPEKIIKNENKRKKQKR